MTDLVEGFESAFGLELLATVHWVLKHEAPKPRDDLIALTYAWNARKRSFSPRQIGLAADVLAAKGWIDCAKSAVSGNGHRHQRKGP